VFIFPEWLIDHIKVPQIVFSSISMVHEKPTPSPAPNPEYFLNHYIDHVFFRDFQVKNSKTIWKRWLQDTLEAS
jgi:hypothetical protein